jgi:hypothetical protein
MSDIDVKYAALGGPGGWLGPATTPELVAPDGVGHYRHLLKSTARSPTTRPFRNLDPRPCPICR